MSLGNFGEIIFTQFFSLQVTSTVNLVIYLYKPTVEIFIKWLRLCQAQSCTMCARSMILFQMEILRLKYTQVILSQLHHLRKTGQEARPVMEDLGKQLSWPRDFPLHLLTLFTTVFFQPFTQSRLILMRTTQHKKSSPKKLL